MQSDAANSEESARRPSPERTNTSTDAALVVATFGLIVVTAYYAWWTRAMFNEQHRQWDEQRRESSERETVALAKRRRGLVRAALYEVLANLHLAPSLHMHHAWLAFNVRQLDALARELPGTRSSSSSSGCTVRAGFRYGCRQAPCPCPAPHFRHLRPHLRGR